jgi:hypothetical protein
MGARTADFGRLVSAFHFEILRVLARKFLYWLVPANARKDTSAVVNTGSHCPEQSGKPKIIANFLNPGNALHLFHRTVSQNKDFKKNCG